MHGKNLKHGAWKQKITHDVRKLAEVFLFLALFLCALATYRMLWLDEFRAGYLRYSAALIEALVLSKIILLGEYARLGKTYEDRPLVFFAVYKSLIFALLVASFYVVEDVVKGFLHGQDLTRTFHELSMDELLLRNLVVFCAFLPFFTLREMQRVLGDVKLADLFFRRGATAASDLPGRTPNA
jgi:hypothetical protein